jgi:FkbM family methyltransferase
MDFAKAPNYIRRFGLRHGLRLFCQIERDLSNKSEKIRSYEVPGLPPIYLRDTVADHRIFWQCLVRDQYDFRVFPHCSRLMERYNSLAEPLIVDCGGNIGLASVCLAVLLPKANIIAVEPSEANVAMIERNIVAFKGRVRVVHGAVWHEPGTVQIVNPDAGSAVLRVGAGSGIRAYTIAELTNGRAPFIVKMDIEGAEKTALTANNDWVGQTDLIMMELHDWCMPWQGTSRAFFSSVSRFPYEYMFRDETFFCFRAS